MKTQIQKNNGFSFIEVLVVVCTLAILAAIVIPRSLMKIPTAAEKNQQIGKSEGIQEALGHPAQLTKLNAFTYTTFLGSFQGIDGNVYVVALVGTNSAPMLFNAGTNEPPREARERSILLYDGKRFISMPKEKLE